MTTGKKRRAVTIIIVLLFLFSLLLSYLLPKKYGLSSTDFFSPIFITVKNFTEEVRSIFNTIVNIRQISREKNDLKIQIQKLQREINNLKEISIENKRLRELLAFKEEIPYQTVPAKIIGREASNWYKSIIIDKGKNQGLQIDMPVVSYGGVVGKIIEAMNNTSIVILITDKKSRLGGIIQATRYAGIIEGTGRNLCRMKYILKDADLKTGEIVASSGFGGIYPKGLRIGTIVQIYDEKYGLYKYVDVEPLVDFNRLEEVLILLKQK
jgi:rod shape-determining protein MreC